MSVFSSAGILQFQHRQRQPIDEHDDVRALRVVRPLDGELIDGCPVVVVGVRKINQPHEIADRFAVPLIFDFDPIAQPAVKLPIALDQRGQIRIDDLLNGVFNRGGGNGGIDDCVIVRATDPPKLLGDNWRVRA